MEAAAISPTTAIPEAPRLKRVLGRRDLVLLFVVAVVNLNVVPSIAANGPVTIWLWLLALLFFFWPQGIAVVELSRRWPEEGGVYLWAKKSFGDFHGFLSGWCYWTNNVFYIPTVLLYLVGVAVYGLGERGRTLANQPSFTFMAALIALVALVALNIRGLGVGKWVNNVGGIGTLATAIILVVLGTVMFTAHGTSLTPADFRPAGADWRIVSAFGTICFGLVGLELGSVMGDEIRDPRRTVPGAVMIGGIISGLLYIGATLTLLIAVPQSQIGILQGVLQAVSAMAGQAGASWLIRPMVVLLTISIAGIASAWLSGSARIPFVAGLDSYLPAALGRLHPRYATPYVALAVHGLFSALFMIMSFAGATVKQAFDLMLALAVVLQLVPFLYVYAVLIRLGFAPQTGGGHYGKIVLRAAGISGLVTTALGMIVAFVPPREANFWPFELKMFAGVIFFIGLGAFFFFIYDRRQGPRPA